MPPQRPRDPELEGSGNRRFLTTRWSLVVQAGHDNRAGRQALEQLCHRYWYPLYAYLRRQGRAPDQAHDLTQGFFTRMIETGDIGKAAADRGRFRSYMLTCLKHFVANDWDRQQARKRGGGREVLSLDTAEAESRYQMEPVDNTTPEILYERRWAMTLLDTVAKRLAAEMRDKERGGLFDQLKIYLDGSGPPYAELADRLQTTEGAIKTAVHRLRSRFRELLRSEIRETLNDPADVDDELGHLLEALRQ